MNVLFDEATHKYTDETGKVYPSVTEIIGKFLPKPNIPQHILDAAAWRGTCVHKAIELMEQDNLGEYDPSLQPYLDNWVKFREAGFIDYIADAKSGSEQLVSHFLQLQAYHILAVENKVVNGYEVPLISKKYAFAGKIDVVAGNPNNLLLVYLKDYKVYRFDPEPQLFLTILDRFQNK